MDGDALRQPAPRDQHNYRRYTSKSDQRSGDAPGCPHLHDRHYPARMLPESRVGARRPRQDGRSGSRFLFTGADENVAVSPRLLGASSSGDTNSARTRTIHDRHVGDRQVRPIGSGRSSCRPHCSTLIHGGLFVPQLRRLSS
jgi:hypothetical protein